MYEECNTLRIGYAAHSDLDIRENNEKKWDFVKVQANGSLMAL